MMKKLQILIAFTGLISIQNSHANEEEVDQFTILKEQSQLSDSSLILNAKVNQLFDQALIEANKKGQCDGETPEESGMARNNLYEALAETMAHSFWGNSIVDFVQNENTIPKSKTPLDKSIYAKKSMHEFDLKLAPVIQFKNTFLGTDKLTEFFAAGYSRFRELRFNKTESGRKDPAERASLAMENRGKSPVLSWADHSARMKGYSFWDSVCGAPNKDATPNEKEYFAKNGCHAGRLVKCESGKWKRNPERAKIDLAEYIDDSWDESINCSQYRDEVLDDIVGLMATANENASRVSTPPCPVDQKKCLDLVNKDTPYISPVCQKVAVQIKNKKPTTTDLRTFENKSSAFDQNKKKNPRKHRGVVTGS